MRQTGNLSMDTYSGEARSISLETKTSAPKSSDDITTSKPLDTQVDTRPTNSYHAHIGGPICLHSSLVMWMVVCGADRPKHSLIGRMAYYNQMRHRLNHGRSLESILSSNCPNPRNTTQSACLQIDLRRWHTLCHA